MKAFLAIGVFALVAPLSSGETRLGTGVNLKDTTAIRALVEQPASYVGKTIRVDGIATAVCTHMGCWMAVAAEGDEKGPIVRLKVDDGVIVFPVTAKAGRSPRKASSRPSVRAPRPRTPLGSTQSTTHWRRRRIS